MAYRNSPARNAGGTLERKDDTGADGKPLDTKQALSDFMGAFEEFKTANDERLKAVEGGKTDPLGEEKLTKINGFLDKYEGLNQKLTLAEKNADALKEHEEKFDQLETLFKRTHQGEGGNGAGSKVDPALWAKAVVGSYTIGVPNLPEEQRKAIDDVNAEYKALNVSTNAEGGYLAPVEYVREILKTVTEISPVRSLARVRQTGNRALEIPKRTGQFAAQWVAEQASKTETDGLRYGVEELTTHEMYALIDITNQMLEDSLFNMTAEISEESAEQFALAEGEVFVKGNGVGKPEGFMTHAHIDDTASGSASSIADTNGGADGLLTMKYSLKSLYARNATFLMNRTTMGSVRKLKGNDKDYLWQPGIALGQPNTIDGDPYVEIPDMPSEGSGTFPIAYGDFRRGYTWVDRIAMEMLRDPYTQATGGKVRFIMRKRVAGKVTMAEAIKKLKCASS